MKDRTQYQVGNVIESLDLDDLDVVGLESRLELAPMTPPGCSQHGSCESLCSSDITWHC